MTLKIQQCIGDAVNYKGKTSNLMAHFLKFYFCGAGNQTLGVMEHSTTNSL